MPYNNIVRQGTYRPGESVDLARRSALSAVMQLLMPVPGLIMTHRRELLTIALWKWTEASGVAPHPKYNIRFATTGALNRDVTAKINHEHVWPRKWLIDNLLQRYRTSNEPDIWNFLAEYAVACIVTVDEHARLGGVTGVGWQRYAAARIEVRDLQTMAPLDLGAVIPPERANDLPGEAGVDLTQPVEPEEAIPELHHEVVREVVSGSISVEDALERFAGSKSDLLKRLVEIARLAGAAAVVGSTKTAEHSVGAYVRIHDALIAEPTRAAAWVHWNGRVSLGLVADDVPDALLNSGGVSTNKHQTYGVGCKVDDTTSLQVAAELLLLALEKVRESFKDGEL